MAKRQKLQHPQQHARLPPFQQSGQSHTQHWNGAPTHQVNNSQPPMPTVANHHQYAKPRGPPGGPGRYPPSGAGAGGGYYQDRGGQSGAYSSGQYPTQGRGPPPYPGNSAPPSGPRGNGGGGYVAPPPSYSQSGQYGVSSGRGSNPTGGGNRSQQYGWQQQ